MPEPKFNLVVDSSCDLYPQDIDEPGITLLSLTYNDGVTDRKDDLFQTMSAHDFYESMRRGVTYTTSMVNQETAREAFEALAKEGKPTLSVSFSSGISGTYESCANAARAVRQEHPDFELYTVDALVGCTPLGVLIKALLKIRREGATAKEAYDWIESAKWRVQTLFMVEDLDALHRGGRLPASVAVAGTKLDVKPMLSFDLQGKLTVVGIARGRKKGLRQLAEFYLKNRDPGPMGSWALVGNADCPEDVARIEKLIHKDPAGKDSQIIPENIGAVIGSHVGPGMISCCFFGPDRRETRTFAQRVAGVLKR